MKSILTKLFGTKHERDAKKMQPLVDEINDHFEKLRDLSEEELVGKTEEFRKRLAEGETLDDIMCEAFAVVKEACRRHVGQTWDLVGQATEWNMVHFDVQLMGGIALHKGKIAEMATGEGKTLVATLPTYLNALTGKGVHIVTVNDYLAQRDREWMGKIYEYLGLTVGVIQNQMTNAERRVMYECDVTFGTANEFGFDYLRDNMAQTVEDRVHRNYFYAIIDEVDSILIDEARTPLIISGQVESSTHDRYRQMKPTVETLVRKQSTLINDMVAKAEKLLESEKAENEFEAGSLLLAANRGAPKNKRLMKIMKETGMKKLVTDVESSYMREKKLYEIDDRLYYYIDEREHSIALTDLGNTQFSKDEQQLFEIPDLSTMLSELDGDESLSPEERQKKTDELYRLHGERSEKVHAINQLLRAYSLYEKDVEYVLQEGKVMIVDEFTGRILPGRRYSDGLHQSIEAKEGVKIESESQTLATITLQNYFRMYDKLAGMTGTAETEASEFWDIYKLDVMVIPTNELCIRDDREDQVFRTRREKYNAIVDEITQRNEQGQPVLVGTVSVDVSETLSRMLKRKGVPHHVLNAKHHQKEAEIVANAGQSGSVTIATNMAGRGTDIKLGSGVIERGGLHIVGTERHESRRIDRQLRGRSGRQGDPGSSRFFLSLQDDLMRIFASDWVRKMMDRLGMEEDVPIESKMVSKSILRAQTQVEGRNFDIRKHLLEYDDVMNKQREAVYSLRRKILAGEEGRGYILGVVDEIITSLLGEHCPEDSDPEDWATDTLEGAVHRYFGFQLADAGIDWDTVNRPDLEETVRRLAKEAYEERVQRFGDEEFARLEKFLLLDAVDRQWKDHLLSLDHLREGIGLRAYGQRNPLVEYKRESFSLFEDMWERIEDHVVKFLYHAEPAEDMQLERRRVQTTLVRPEVQGLADADRERSAQEKIASQPVGGSDRPTTVRRSQPKVGRNDPCPCGSGKKYKKCCGAKAAQGA